MEQAWRIRFATEADIPALHRLIELSVRALQQNDYTSAQIEGALGSVLGLDTTLIRDRTYFLAEPPTGPETSRPAASIPAGCGGWSMRKTLFGSDGASGREPDLLHPAHDAARIRAIFVHPNSARQGLGSALLAHVEAQAAAAGFRRFEMGSTFTGIPLYRLRGYQPCEQLRVPLPNGESLPILRMTKSVTPPANPDRP